MERNIKGLAERLLQTGFEDLPEREQRVLRLIADRVAISRNPNLDFHDKLTLGQRVADKVAAFGGSWTFIILFALILVAWIALNSWLLSTAERVDPYPFVFLNLILSMLAAIQAPVIMMSQNRQTAKDRHIAAQDYEVNLKAELEIMNLHEKLDDMRMRQLETLLMQQGEQISDIKRLMQTVGATSPEDEPQA